MNQSAELENIVLKKQIVKLKQIAEYDGLCQIYNRQTVEAAINNVLLKNQRGVLMVIDVDKFKHLNDHFGHLLGDRALKKIADALISFIGSDDFVGRIGGDEFVIFLNQKVSQELLNLKMRQLQEMVGNLDLLEIGSPKLSISIAASIVTDDDTYETLFDRADQQLMKIKRLMKLNDRNLEAQEESKLCYDFETFCELQSRIEKEPYRIIAITLLNKKRDVPLLSECNQEAVKLAKCIDLNLRSGDYYTRYSSNQFLILCKYLEQDRIGIVSKRIQDAFEEENDNEHIIKISELNKKGGIYNELNK